MSQLIANKRLPWKRFWATPDTKIDCGIDGRGFLSDPEGRYAGFWNGHVRLGSDLLDFGCVVLSGQPGIGKTIEVEGLQERIRTSLRSTDALIAFHCRAISSDAGLRLATIADPRWRAALDVGGHLTLVIDGVDEGLRKVPEFVHMLGHWLTTESADSIARLRLILVCRTVEWDVSAGESLMRHWPESKRGGLFELCPLRWCDAELAARESGLDAEAFIEAVRQNRVAGLAARPITLRMLLQEFRTGSGLPRSHRILYSNAARRMCEEFDEGRARRLLEHNKAQYPTTDIHRVVCRIAALMMICGRSSILRDTEIKPGATDLEFSSIAVGVEEVDGRKFEVTAGHVKAALDTAHFSFRGLGRYGFDHATFAECLAADYLRTLTVSQLRKVLCQRFDGRDLITPQLAEVAAWLAGSHRDWCEFLVESEPEVLLRADVGGLADDLKARAVANLLARVDYEDADDFGGSEFYRTLRHPRLAEQLRPYINNTKHNVVVRRMAIELAGDADLKELEADLWQILEDGRGSEVRNAIAHALGDLAGPHSKRNLLRILRGEIGPDPNRDLRGIALRKLVPEMMPVRRAVKFLRDVRETNYFGAYEMVLSSHLPEHLTVSDLPIVLRAMTRWSACFDRISPLRRLAAKAFDLALQQIGKPQVRSLLVRMWRHKQRSYHAVPEARGKLADEDTVVGLADTEKRRRFVAVLLNSSETQTKDLDLYEERLLGADDLGWLLEQLPSVPKARRKLWAKIAAGFVWRTERDHHREAVLRTYAAVPEFRAALPPLKKGDILTTIARQVRAAELRNQRKRRRSLRIQIQPSRRTLMLNALQGLRRGDCKWWAGIVAYARIEEKTDTTLPESTQVSHSDIRSLPGWKELTAEEQQVAETGAREFLHTQGDLRDDPDQWTTFCGAACVAIRLLRDQINTDPALRRVITSKWIAAIVDHWDDSESGHDEMVALAQRLNGPKTIECLLRKLRKSDQADGYALALRAFAGCWNKRICKAVLAFVVDEARRSRTRNRILLFLAENDPPAVTRALGILLNRLVVGKALDQTARAVVAMALFHGSENYWDAVFPRITRASSKIAQSVFLENSDDLDLTDRDLPVLNKLKDHQLADLYLLLVRLFPHEEFQERHGPQGTVSARHRMPDLREGCLRILVARATESSCDQIQRIVAASLRKSRVWLKCSYREALRGRLRKQWSLGTLSPEVVLRFVRSSAATAIHDENDLADAVVASLERLQMELPRGELPKVSALWNEPPRGSPTPKAETALSNLIHDWLRADLGPASGVIVNREAQVSRLGKLDVKIEALPGGELDRKHLELIIEVKRCSHRDVSTACKMQLVHQYLKPSGWTHGIYLVGWFGFGFRRKWTSLANVASSVDQWARAASRNPYHVRGLALDCRLHRR